MCRGILSISCCRLIKKHSIMNISVLQNMVKSMHKWALILSTWCNHAWCYWEWSLWKLIDHVCNNVTRRQAKNNVVEKTLRHIVISYLGTFKISLDSIASIYLIPQYYDISLLVYTSNILIMILAFKVNNAYPNEAMSIIQLISRTINHTMQVIVRDGTESFILIFVILFEWYALKSHSFNFQVQP